LEEWKTSSIKKNNSLLANHYKNANLNEKKKNEKEISMKTMLTVLLLSLFALSFIPSVWAAEQSSGNPSTKDIVDDVLWIRPLGLTRLILEAAAFVVVLPVALPFNKVDDAKEFLIKDPYTFVFERPLGEM
jgi:hypothetical protein